MVYTLANNAISSLHIAIENFKKFFYHYDDYQSSEIDEYTKICITFLENAIELLLKVILVNREPLSIYVHPESRKIQEALNRVTETTRLEDILIAEGNFQTIKYSEAVELYNNMFHNSDKVYSVLTKLGEVRNAITHFGLYRVGTRNDLIIEIINAFDVIYNYLYPQIVDIESIEDIFTSDGIFVKTIHGYKPLIDESYIYNNVIDFLDELMEESDRFAISSRINNPQNRINEFVSLMKSTIEDQKFEKLLKRNQVEIDFMSCEFDANDYYFNIIKDGEIVDIVMSCYSRYNNVTAFCDEGGYIYFLIVHDKGELYLYENNLTSTWPQWTDPEPNKLWETDSENGLCKKLNLSKRNILKAFDNITSNIQMF